MEILFLLVGVVFGAGGLFSYEKIKADKARNNSDKILADAEKKSAQIITRANDKAHKIAADAKKDEAERRAEIRKIENRLAEREKSLDKKLDSLDTRAEKLRKAESEVETIKNEALEIRNKQTEKLERKPHQKRG